MIYKVKILLPTDFLNFIIDPSNNFSWIQEKGYFLRVQEERIDKQKIKIISLALYGKNNDSLFSEEDILYIFKHQLSEIIADYILFTFKDRIIKKFVNKKYPFIQVEDREVLQKRTESFLYYYDENESFSKLMSLKRKNKIVMSIIDHFESSNLIIIEGFVNFCMQDYIDEIIFAMELAYEELKNEKEYNEFIKLLRYFVESQAPKVYEVNLLINDSGKFSLWDGDGVRIEKDYMNLYLNDFFSDEITLDDALVSILITIAPRRIVLHNSKLLSVNESVETIKRIFNERINFCNGCEECYELEIEFDRKK